MLTLDEKILSNLKTVLESVPGFSASTVFRFSQLGHAYDDVPCIDIVFGGADFIKCTNIYSDFDMTVHIDIFTRDSSSNTDAVMSALTHDVIKAIMADPTRGGLALNTEIKKIEPFLTALGQPEVMRSIDLNIRYRINTKNPDQN